MLMIIARFTTLSNVVSGERRGILVVDDLPSLLTGTPAWENFEKIFHPCNFSWLILIFSEYEGTTPWNFKQGWIEFWLCGSDCRFGFGLRFESFLSAVILGKVPSYFWTPNMPPPPPPPPLQGLETLKWAGQIGLNGIAKQNYFEWYLGHISVYNYPNKVRITFNSVQINTVLV